MKKLCYFFMCMAIAAMQTAKAQYYYNERYYEGDLIFEAGLSPGIMNCLTDLGGKPGAERRFMKDLNWKTTKPCFSIYAAALYRYAFTAGLTLTCGSVNAYDSILRSSAGSMAGRYERNLSFESPILEARLTMEAHPVYIFNLYREGHAPRLSPYLSVGSGFFRFDPGVMYNGAWYRLHPLHTEGQGFPGGPGKVYSLSQVNISLGAGIRYELSDLLNVHAEVMHRVLFTDYLDDVSTSYADPSLFFRYLPAEFASVARQLADRRGELDPLYVPSGGGKRGDPKNKDSFFSVQLKLGIVLGRVRKRDWKMKE